MNRKLLKAKMKEYGESGRDLADALGIVRQTLSCKLTGNRGDFTLSEVVAIKKRYDLTDEETIAIFFED